MTIIEEVLKPLTKKQKRQFHLKSLLKIPAYKRTSWQNRQIRVLQARIAKKKPKSAKELKKVNK